MIIQPFSLIRWVFLSINTHSITTLLCVYIAQCCDTVMYCFALYCTIHYNTIDMSIGHSTLWYHFTHAFVLPFPLIQNHCIVRFSKMTCHSTYWLQVTPHTPNIWPMNYQIRLTITVQWFPKFIQLLNRPQRQPAIWESPTLVSLEAIQGSLLPVIAWCANKPWKSTSVVNII